MSFKTQILTWDVPLEQVQIGVAIGYDIQFSSNSFFSPIFYRISSYDEITASLNTFYYSLDGGITYLLFPKYGMAFFTAYKMKVVISSAEASKIFIEKDGTIYAITGDGKTIIDSYVINSFNSTGFEIDARNNLYLSGQNKTAYVINTASNLVPGNSVNLRSEPLGIAIDAPRNILWQIDRTTVSAKDLRGNIIFSRDLPVEIDIEWSSSSSSSYSSSSSSSSSVSSSSFSSSSSSSYSSSTSSSQSSSSTWVMTSSSSFSSSTWIRSSSSSSTLSSSSTWIRSSSSSNSSSSSSTSYPICPSTHWYIPGGFYNLSNLVITGLDDCEIRQPYPNYRTFGISTGYEYVDIMIYMQIYYGPGDIRWEFRTIGRGYPNFVYPDYVAGTFNIYPYGSLCTSVSGTIYYNGTPRGPYNNPFPIVAGTAITCI